MISYFERCASIANCAPISQSSTLFVSKQCTQYSAFVGSHQKQGIALACQCNHNGRDIACFAFLSILIGLTGLMLIYRVDFRAQEDRQSPIVEHAQSLLQPPNSTGFAAMRFLMFSFPFIV